MSKRVKKHVIVATIGARDLRYKPCNDMRHYLGSERDYGHISCGLGCDPTLRSITELLWDRVEARTICYEQLRIPILKPGLEFSLGRMDPDDNSKIELYLIVTDQNPAHHMDTLYSGRVIVELVKTWFSAIKVVESLGITNGPHERAPIYERVRKRFSSLGDIEALWVLPTGGTPAMSEAVRLAGMNLYGDERCKVVEVGRPGDDSDGAGEGVAKLATQDPYVRDGVRISAETLIKHRNYEAALTTLTTKHRFEWDRVLMHLLKHASARVNLVFDTARNEAEKAKKDMRCDELKKLDKTLRLPIDDGDVLGFVSELSYLVAELLRERRWAEALSRIALFSESCRALFVIGCAFARSSRVVAYDVAMRLTYKYLDKEILANSVPSSDAMVADWLRDEVKRVNCGWKIDNSAWKGIIYDNLKRGAGELNCWGRVPCRIDKLRGLVRLRNTNSHVPSGVSRKDLLSEWDGTLDTLKDHISGTVQCLFRCFGADRPGSGDPYERLNTTMLERLRK